MFFFFLNISSVNRKSRSKRYNHRRSDGSNSISESSRDILANVTQIENVSSDEEMVDIETTEEHNVLPHPMQRSVR